MESEPKIKVRETEKVEIYDEHGEVIGYEEVPTKIKIGEKTYEVERVDEFGEVWDVDESGAYRKAFELEKIRDIKLREIPNLISIHCYSPTLIGELSLSAGYASLEVFEKPKYYRGVIPIDYYFDVIKKIATKMGFEIETENYDENGYHLNIAKDFPEDTTVAEACKAFEPISVMIDDIERKVKENINSVLKSFRLKPYTKKKSLRDY